MIRFLNADLLLLFVDSFLCNFGKFCETFFAIIFFIVCSSTFRRYILPPTQKLKIVFRCASRFYFLTVMIEKKDIIYVEFRFYLFNRKIYEKV